MTEKIITVFENMSSPIQFRTITGYDPNIKIATIDLYNDVIELQNQ